MIDKKKKSKVHFSTLIISVLVMFALITINAVAARAAAGPYTVSASLSPNYTIIVDGSERDFYNVSGQEVHPIVYNGTTYLPLRAIGELMGKNVNWDQSTLTVTLAGSRSTPPVTGTPDRNAAVQNISVQIRPDFTIVVDSQVRTFADVSGAQVYPMLYNGTTYLPLRAVGSLMGKEVSWDGATKTVTLTSAGNSGSLVTDADSFNNNGGAAGNSGQTVTSPNTGNYIGEARAKDIALRHAGVSAGSVYNYKCEFDWDNGRAEYEIEFKSGGYEYDIEIDASAGNILKYEKERD